MRKTLKVAAAVAVLATSTGLTAGGAAACDADGSVPGTGPQVVTVATPAGTFYVDDRDHLDLDDDGTAGGIWVYMESNGEPGLQRGGKQVVFTIADPSTPRVGPIQVLPPDPERPVLGNGILLFPGGTYEGPVSYWLGMYDSCYETSPRDTLVF